MKGAEDATPAVVGPGDSDVETGRPEPPTGVAAGFSVRLEVIKSRPGGEWVLGVVDKAKSESESLSGRHGARTKQGP